MSRPLLNKNLANPPFGSALPAIPSLDVVPDRELFYVRFHSRNALGWRLNKMATQFDYDYSDGSSSARRPTCCSSTTTCAARSHGMRRGCSRAGLLKGER